jgi:hypothetical protein
MIVKCFLVNCGMVEINHPLYLLDFACANFVSLKMGTALKGRRFQDIGSMRKNVM